MTSRVRIIRGRFRQQPIENVVFDMVAGLKRGASGSWITVDGASADGFPDHKLRIKVDDNSSFEIFESKSNEQNFEEKPVETDEQIIKRIRTRFNILEEMANATIDGVIRGLVVSGPPGVGKSYGIEKLIDQANIQAAITNSKSVFGIERGSATPIGLYQLLYQYSEEGSVLVLDDSDTVLYDEVSLNLLKAVLDSGKKRKVSWRSESRVLEKESIPPTFEFKGSVIFITNLKLEKTRGKLGDHMNALLSRCHYIDLEIDNTRDKFLRCKQIIMDGMLRNRGFTVEQETEIVDFIYENKHNLREISLRMVSKIADLYEMSSSRWKEFAKNTCMT